MNNNSITDDFNTQVQCEEVYTEEASNVVPPDTDRRVIDLTPSWETAVNICIMILESSTAAEEAKETCREELRRLAKHVDEQQKKQ